MPVWTGPALRDASFCLQLVLKLQTVQSIACADSQAGAQAASPEIDMPPETSPEAALESNAVPPESKAAIRERVEAELDAKAESIAHEQISSETVCRQPLKCAP